MRDIEPFPDIFTPWIPDNIPAAINWLGTQINRNFKSWDPIQARVAADWIQLENCFQTITGIDMPKTNSLFKSICGAQFAGEDSKRHLNTEELSNIGNEAAKAVVELCTTPWKEHAGDWISLACIAMTRRQIWLYKKALRSKKSRQVKKEPDTPKTPQTPQTHKTRKTPETPETPRRNKKEGKTDSEAQNMEEEEDDVAANISDADSEGTATAQMPSTFSTLPLRTSSKSADGDDKEVVPSSLANNSAVKRRKLKTGAQKAVAFAGESGAVYTIDGTSALKDRHLVHRNLVIELQDEEAQTDDVPSYVLVGLSAIVSDAAAGMDHQDIRCEHLSYLKFKDTLRSIHQAYETEGRWLVCRVGGGDIQEEIQVEDQESFARALGFLEWYGKPDGEFFLFMLLQNKI